MLWLALYLIGFHFVWYENRFVVCDYGHRPLFFSHANQTVFWIVRLLITYGSIAGIWHAYGWQQALVAVAVYYTFEAATFRPSYDREFREEYSTILKYFREDMASKGEPSDEEALMRLASQSAHRTILRNMKGGLP
jgi:hypothetical protein